MADNPFAQFAPKAEATTPTNPFSQFGGSPQPSKPAPSFNTRQAMDPVFHSLVAPVLNAIDYPVRAGVADIAAAIPGVGAFPTDKASRDVWQRVRDHIIARTAVPETGVGKALSGIASIPGSLIQKGARAVANTVLGKDAADALSPLGQAAMDAMPFAAAKLGADRAAAGPLSPKPLAAERTPKPAAQQAHQAGYLLAPEEVADRTGPLAGAVAAISGKDKKFQQLSSANERVTDDLAATAIGLPKGTVLNETAFNRARQPAISAYRAFEGEVPTVVTGADPAFRAGVEKIGSKGEALEAEYPEAAHNPAIAELRQQLLSNPLNSTKAVIDKISDLRLEAGRNFRRDRMDNHAHALGTAQREAANLLEDQIERSISYNPDHIQALADYHTALEERAKAQAGLAGKRVQSIGMPAANQAVADAAQRLQQTAQVDPARAARAHQLVSEFRDARKLFARIFDVELATNKSTNHVVARRIANLRTRHPLTDELKEIADAHDAFPKSLKESAKSGGHPEDWSILDAWGIGTSLVHGHPLIAAGIAARPAVRSRLLTSPWFQNRLLNPRAGFDVSRLLQSLPAGYATGLAAQPPAPQPSMQYRIAPPSQ